MPLDIEYLYSIIISPLCFFFSESCFSASLITITVRPVVPKHFGSSFRWRRVFMFWYFYWVPEVIHIIIDSNFLMVASM